jgi:hypothetical protein
VTGASANGKSEPFDLEAAANARLAEAEAAPFAFTYHGKTYGVPPASVWPLSALRLVAKGELDDALPMLLGQVAYEELSEAGLTLGELNTLFEGIAARYGLDTLPNSAPSRRRGSTRR